MFIFLMYGDKNGRTCNKTIIEFELRYTHSFFRGNYIALLKSLNITDQNSCVYRRTNSRISKYSTLKRTLKLANDIIVSAQARYLTLDLTLSPSSWSFDISGTTHIKNVIKLPDFVRVMNITLLPSIDTPDVIVSNKPKITLGRNIGYNGNIPTPVWDYGVPQLQVGLPKRRKSTVIQVK